MTTGVFPGQGLEARVVADALAIEHPRIIEASEILGFDLPLAVRRATRGSKTRSALPTDLAQVAIFVAGIVSFESARNDDVEFDRLIGHSLGEYTSLVAARALSFQDGLRVVATRGAAMKRASLMSDAGMIATTRISREIASEICAVHDVYVANDNSPDQIVLAGTQSNLARAAAAINEAGGRSVLLPVDGAFHTVAMAPAASSLRTALDGVEIRSPRIEVIANVTAMPYRSPGEIRELCVRQLTETVRFRESILYALRAGSQRFIDLGPGRVVDRLVAQTTTAFEDAPHV